jgi:hypothetical protein
VDSLVNAPQDSSFLDPLKRDLRELESNATAARRRADKLRREADLIESDATQTRAEAEGLDALVAMAVEAGDGAVKYAQDTLHEILNSKESQDLENMLREAEEMLEELKDREFSQAADDAEMELDKAIDGENLHTVAIKSSPQCLITFIELLTF